MDANWGSEIVGPLRAVPTLVLSHRYSPDSNALFSAALSARWDVERLHSFRCPEGLNQKNPVFYGETLLADAIADELGIVLLEPSADWLPALPERHRLRDIRLSTLRAALQIEKRIFVKPTDEKCFPARVYENGAAIDPDPQLDLDLPVLTSEPVRFEVEFRFFIVERRIAAFSPYIRHGNIARDDDGQWNASEKEIDDATATMNQVLQDPLVEMPAAVVVDVGWMVDRGWGVVEANPAWASGICGANPLGILSVLERASVSKNKLTETDARWARRVTTTIER